MTYLQELQTNSRCCSRCLCNVYDERRKRASVSAVFALGCRPDSVGQYTNLGIAVQEKRFHSELTAENGGVYPRPFVLRANNSSAHSLSIAHGAPHKMLQQ